MTVYNSSNRTTRKETRDEVAETLSKAFDMSRATAKVSPESLKENDQDSVKKARRSQVERS